MNDTPALKPPARVATEGIGSTASLGSVLRLTLHASGNVNQLAGILEDTAQRLRKNEEIGHTFPWFVTVCGSVNFDWRVDDRTSA